MERLYNYALEGKINIKDLDQPLTFQDRGMVLVLPDKVFESPEELVVALDNNPSPLRLGPQQSH